MADSTITTILASALAGLGAFVVWCGRFGLRRLFGVEGDKEGGILGKMQHSLDGLGEAIRENTDAVKDVGRQTGEHTTILSKLVERHNTDVEVTQIPRPEHLEQRKPRS